MENLLKQYRIFNKLSQEMVARKCDISLRYYVNIEKGIQLPNVYLAQKISLILNTDITTLFPTNKIL